MTQRSGTAGVLGAAGEDPAAAFAPRALLARAEERTGLSSGSGAIALDALAPLCAAFAREAGAFSLLGRKRAEHVLVESLAKALRLHDYLERFPEIARARARAPIFIVAPFRTGTTFLHRLLAQDPALRWLRTWESAAAPPRDPDLRLDAACFEKDPRIAPLEQSLERLHRLNPSLREVHETGARLPEECFGLLETTLCSHSFMFYGRVPDYLAWLDDRDEAAWLASYRTYELQLALLQWWSPGERWLLKSPVHLWNVDTLLALFPDALIVQLHRDPLRCVPSFCRLLAAHYAFAYRRVDDRAIGAFAHAYLRKALARGAAARSRLPRERFVDVDCEALAADPMACVRRIYERAGGSLTPAAAGRMRAWLAGRGDGGAHAPAEGAERYGLEPQALQRDFETYDAYRGRGDGEE